MSEQFFDPTDGSFDLEEAFAVDPLTTTAGLVSQAAQAAAEQAAAEIAALQSQQRSNVEAQLAIEAAERRVIDKVGLDNYAPTVPRIKERLSDPTFLSEEAASDVNALAQRIEEAYRLAKLDHDHEAQRETWEGIAKAGRTRSVVKDNQWTTEQTNYSTYAQMVNADAQKRAES